MSSCSQREVSLVLGPGTRSIPVTAVLAFAKAAQRWRPMNPEEPVTHTASTADLASCINLFKNGAQNVGRISSRMVTALLATSALRPQTQSGKDRFGETIDVARFFTFGFRIEQHSGLRSQALGQSAMSRRNNRRS